MADFYARDWAPADTGGSDREGPRIVVWDRVFAAMLAHSRTDTENEVAGFLLGSTIETELAEAPVVVVEASLPARHVNTGAAHVEFTHDTWTAFHEEREADFPAKRIVGWYHTHPNIGLFLSAYDTFIHENFFKEADRIALVIDPVQDTAAFFKRIDGGLDPVRCFGFTELSSSLDAVLEPGANLELQAQSTAAAAGVPASVLPRAAAAPAGGRPEPGIRELISMVRRVAIHYWRAPLTLRVRALLARLAGKDRPPLPPTAAVGSELARRDSGSLLRELESLEADLDQATRSQTEADEQAAAATSAVARFRQALASRVHDMALEVGRALAWTMLSTVALAAIVAALLLAPIQPLSGDMGGWPRWTVAALSLASGLGLLGASTATALGPLSTGLASRWGSRLAASIERRLTRWLRLG